MQKPIGIFDSGVGGLTVASAIKQLLPQESFVYYGDTRHAPYGDKSVDTIAEYSERIVKFLKQENCKAVVIACNTASATAYQKLVREFPDIPILNVVDPVVEFVAQQPNTKVGIIATRATIRSKIYEKQLKKLQPDLETVSQATPLLAPMVEEGFAKTDISQGALREYLSDPDFADITSLILGCTHYPLLEGEIRAFYRQKVTIVDSPPLVAARLREVLEQHNLLGPQSSDPEYRFYLSEKTPAFDRIAKIFFGEDISLTEKVLSP